MEELDQSRVRQLVDENPRFRLLYEEHLLLEKELLSFDSRPYLSADDELVRKKIQKLKLAGKDEMVRMLKSGRQ